MTQDRGKILQRRSAQLRRKRWEGTITGPEEDELRQVQNEILARHLQQRGRIHL